MDMYIFLSTVITQKQPQFYSQKNQKQSIAQVFIKHCGKVMCITGNAKMTKTNFLPLKSGISFTIVYKDRATSKNEIQCCKTHFRCSACKKKNHSLQIQCA